MRNKIAKVVGVFNNEIYIYEGDSSVINNFCVLRLVEKTDLEALQTISFWISEHRDYWVSAVNADETDLGLEDWMEEFFNEEMALGDDEYFPLKDCSGCEYLGDETRKLIDKWILETDDIEVGTWEASGYYSPCSFHKDFTKFDLVIDEELAEKYYQQIAK